MPYVVQVLVAALELSFWASWALTADCCGTCGHMRRMRNAPCALDQLDKNLTNGLTYLVLFSLSLPNYSDNSLG